MSFLSVGTVDHTTSVKDCVTVTFSLQAQEHLACYTSDTNPSRTAYRSAQNLILPSATCSWVNIFVDPGTTLLLTN